MNKFINSIIAFVSPFAAVPTGWAIYAGVTQQSVFPVWMPAAICGAVAIVTIDIAAASLIVDILNFNQSLKNKTEHELFEMDVKQAWGVLIGAVVAEITLSLLIVVFESMLAWGVVVFPLMTLAGVFAYALRVDLQKRETERDGLRAKPKRNTTTEKQTRNKKIVARKPITDKQLNDYWLRNPHASNTEVAEHFGVTRQAIGKRKAKLYDVAQKGS